MHNIIKITLATSLLLAQSFVGIAFAADKSKEIDLIYSKLVSALPNEGTMMTSPYADSLQTFGENIVASFNKQSDALGGVALEVKTNRSKNPWDAGIFNVLGTPIEKGDVIYMAFFAKALEISDVGDTAIIKNVGVQKGAEPYTTVIGRDFKLSSAWQSFALAGVAGESYEAKETQVSMQIATGKFELAVGPVFVFNLGKGVDPASLPFITQ